MIIVMDRIVTSKAKYEVNEPPCRTSTYPGPDVCHIRHPMVTMFKDQAQMSLANDSRLRRPQRPSSEDHRPTLVLPILSTEAPSPVRMESTDSFSQQEEQEEEVSPNSLHPLSSLRFGGRLFSPTEAMEYMVSTAPKGAMEPKALMELKEFTESEETMVDPTYDDFLNEEAIEETAVIEVPGAEDPKKKSYRVLQIGKDPLNYVAALRQSQGKHRRRSRDLFDPV